MARLIPHLNLKDYLLGSDRDRRGFVKTLGDGLLEFGFLTIEGHGIPTSYSAKLYHLFERFFAMEETAKRRYDRIPGGARGYTPFGRERAKDAAVPDLKEFWHIGRDLPGGHPYRGEYPDNIWPEELPEIKPAALAFYQQLELCAQTLLRALAEYFGLPGETFAAMTVDGDSVLRVIHYPPLPESAPPHAVRAAAHEDINFLTLLAEARGQGLEILTREGKWVAVDALKGDIVVDSGDMLSRVTNGVVPATTHRVVNPDHAANRSRYSMPFFVHPYSACDLTVMEAFTEPERPARWPPITAGAFLKQRLAENGLLANQR